MPTIIHIDDDADDRMLLKEVMNELFPHIDLIEFPQGSAAMDFLLQTTAPISLIILDLNMPGMDGRMFLTEMRKNFQLIKIPVILFTTSYNPIDKSFAKENGVEMITKPAAISRLKEEVKKMMQYATNIDLNETL